MTLEKFIQENGFCPKKSMNLLNFHGLISDNAIVPADVAEVDQSAAIEFLRQFIGVRRKK